MAKITKITIELDGVETEVDIDKARELYVTLKQVFEPAWTIPYGAWWYTPSVNPLHYEITCGDGTIYGEYINGTGNGITCEGRSGKNEILFDHDTSRDGYAKFEFDDSGMELGL